MYEIHTGKEAKIRISVYSVIWLWEFQFIIPLGVLAYLYHLQY